MIFPIILLFTGAISACTITNDSVSGSENCDPVNVISEVNSIRVLRFGSKGAIAFKGGMAVDADGSPRAYHPEDIGIDALEHAGGNDGYAEGLLYQNGELVIQGHDDPYPGYYVSVTSLEDKSKKVTDPDRYVNPETIPYVVLPPSLVGSTGINLGDIAFVMNEKNDWYTFAIFGDKGPEGLLGEGSIELARRLGINADPRTGGTPGDVVYVFFPGSGNHGPLSIGEIERRGKKALRKFGGKEKLLKCINEI